MRVYVAGKAEEVERVRAAQALLRERGHRVTHDWTEVVEGARDRVFLDDVERDEFLADSALDDYHGVLDADALVLFPHERSKDAYVELGLALGAGIPVVCVARREEMPGAIFLLLEGVTRVDTLDEAAEFLGKLEARYSGFMTPHRVRGVV